VSGTAAPAASLPVFEFPVARRAGLDGEPDAGARAGAFAPFPHVVAWNLTRRCNLACSHCYIAAGSWHGTGSELGTVQCRAILDGVLEVNSSPLLILSGGEPLIREDLEEIAAHASGAGATVVVGTNGTGLTPARIESLKRAGVRGVAVSIDSLRPEYHDRFRHGEHALADTLAAVDRLIEHELDFVVQTTVTRGNRGEVGALAQWAADRGAVSFNLYFVVPTGRGERIEGLSPPENDAVLAELVELERRFRGRMMVRSKCQPQLMRHVVEAGEGSPLLNYRTRCPCGVQYCRITPEGRLTPCPYLPAVAGDLTREPFRHVWERASLFEALRQGTLGGRCGRCEYREVCGGCRARAFAESGDVLGPDESCAYEPVGDRPVVRPRAEVAYGESAPCQLPWTAEARARLERIPSFVRGVVTQRVEGFARARGYAVVDLEVMSEVRRSLPVDFSKRLPFFLRAEPASTEESPEEDAGHA
jgi:radical SAM protein with 4Fe4S-binding SPASM domain